MGTVINCRQNVMHYWLSGWNASMQPTVLTDDSWTSTAHYRTQLSKAVTQCIQVWSNRSKLNSSCNRLSCAHKLCSSDDFCSSFIWLLICILAFQRVKRGSGRGGTKWHGWKTQAWKTRHEMTWVENAGVDNAAQDDMEMRPFKATVEFSWVCWWQIVYVYVKQARR